MHSTWSNINTVHCQCSPFHHHINNPYISRPPVSLMHIKILVAYNCMNLRTVNSVWRGQMAMTVDLVWLKQQLTQPNIKLVRHQIKQPEQLIIKFCDGSTMLMFKSGKFRIMGGGVDDLDMHFNFFSFFFLFDNS